MIGECHNHRPTDDTARKEHWNTDKDTQESLAQFKNRINPWVYVRGIPRSTMYEKSSILLAGTGVRKISTVACWVSPIKIHFSDYPKSLISRIKEVIILLNNIDRYFIEKKPTHINFIYNRLFCCNYTCHCADMVSVTPASRYVTSASRYQSRSSTYIRGLSSRNCSRQLGLRQRHIRIQLNPVH